MCTGSAVAWPNHPRATPPPDREGGFDGRRGGPVHFRDARKTVVYRPNKQDWPARRTDRAADRSGPQAGGRDMLVLSRRLNEAIIIEGGIRVTVVAIKGDRSEERRVGKECRWRWSAYQ